MNPQTDEVMACECLWERPLRVKLAFLCMAAVAGKEGDMRVLTTDIIDFARNLSGAADQVTSHTCGEK
jgi:hypothetical protein